MNDNKINWKQKLSSRKFWAALIGAVTSFGAAFGLSDNKIATITGIISAVSILAIYIFTEGKSDAIRALNESECEVEVVDPLVEGEVSENE